MKDDVKLLFSKGFLVEPLLASSLSNEPFEEISVTDILLSLNPPKLITKNFLDSNINEIIKKLEEKELNKEILEKIKTSFADMIIIKKEIEAPELEVSRIEQDFLDKKRNVMLVEAIETPIKKITVDDFVDYFRSRYNILKTVLQDRELEGLSSIGKISGQRKGISIIGMVSDKKITKNKNMILELEDMTGRISAFIHHDKQDLFEKASQIVLDEVVAIKGTGSDEIIFVSDIIFPEIMLHERKKIQAEHYAIFTSDLHVGSDKFLEENFLKFLDWLNGQTGSIKQKELAKKVKYLFIVGDTVDGVGVYPKQEREIIIKDIREQYRKLFELLDKVRKDITIIMCPGGKHDAVRQIEPQPRIPKELAPDLYAMENLILTTNPSMIKIASTKNNPGFNVLMYHGDSYDYYHSDVDYLRLNNAKLKPDMIIHFLLRKRHLAPTHTSTTYYPYEKDLLTVRMIPDIFVSGHIHKSAVSYYNNILTISCSCWQGKTAYQEKFGHEPDPCKVPLLNLKTGKVSVLDFS